MPLNPYFNHQTFLPEQDLIEDLIVEAIQIHGHETFYLKRDDVDLDTLLGEDELARYKTAWPMEMYIKSAVAFEGRSEFVSKFGLTIEDQCTFVVAVRRFNSIVGGALARPREGDIVWLQMDPTHRYLFEIKFVEDKEQLFQLGKLYTYELRTELITYTHERIQTPVPDINRVAEENAYTLSIMLDSGTGVYIPGETVYQGSSFVDSNATGRVKSYDATTKTLTLIDVTGGFTGSTQIVGMDSNAIHIPTTETPNPLPQQPLAINRELQDDAEQVIVIRGRNPRHSA